jgi:hypothetical protein
MSNAQLVAAAAAVASLSVLSAAVAAPPADAGLFRPAQGAQSVVSPGPTARPGKSRGVQVDAGQLAHGRLHLNLGVGPDLEAVRERSVVHGAQGRAWVGRVAGEPDSEVILFATGKAVAGTIRHRGRLFQLMPGQRGQQRLEEVSPEDPLPPPFEMIPDVGADLMGTGDAGTAVAQATGAAAIVDVLVAYTPEARVAYGGADGIQALIGLAVTETNQAYLNSDAPVQLRLVGTAETSYQDTGDMNADLMALTLPGDGAMDELLTLRDELGADVVSLIVEAGDYCGLSWQMGVLDPAYAAYAFNVVKTTCATGYYSFGHEIGHNLGLSHDHDNASSGLYPYSYGWQDPAAGFRTVMAYTCPLGCTRVQHFSNPEVTYSGAPTGQLDYADNALALTDTAPVVATWRASVVPYAPVAPANLAAAAVSHERIDLGWTDEATDEDGYQIERSVDGADWSLIATLPADATAYGDQPLSPETTYTYRVRAFNGAGVSAASNDAWATTDPAPVLPPAAPTDLAATALSHDEIALSWTDNAADETGYELERSTDAGASWSLLASPGADVSAYTDQGLAASTAYSYRVRAIGVGDASAYSAVASAVTDLAPVYPPAAPTGLGAQALSETAIALSWADNAADETGYELERSTDGGLNWSQAAALPADAQGWTDTALTAGTYYLYRVRAQGVGGASGYSNEAGATTDTPPLSCSVSGAANLTLLNKDTTWQLTNDGTAPITLERIELIWPASQGNLKRVYLDGAEIWSGNASPTSIDVSGGWNADAARRQIAAGASEDLRFNFSARDKGDSQGDYSIVVHFTEGCTAQF